MNRCWCKEGTLCTYHVLKSARRPRPVTEPQFLSMSLSLFLSLALALIQNQRETGCTPYISSTYDVVGFDIALCEAQRVKIIEYRFLSLRSMELRRRIGWMSVLVTFNFSIGQVVVPQIWWNSVLAFLCHGRHRATQLLYVCTHWATLSWFSSKRNPIDSGFI